MRIIRAAVLGSGLVLLTAGAIAQPSAGPGGLRGAMQDAALSESEARASWEAQSRHIAIDVLGLGEEAATTLTRLYVDARTEHRAAQNEFTDRLREAFQSRDQAALQGIRAELTGATETAKAELRSQAAIFLNGPSAERAAALLTVFSPFWDRMAANANGLGLDPDRLRAVLEASGAYAVEIEAAIGPDADRQRRGEIMRSARQRLESALSEVLDTAQVGRVMGGANSPPGGGGPGGGFRRPPPA